METRDGGRESPTGTAPRRSKGLGRRQRRLQITALILGLLGVGAAIALAVAYLDNRPETRRPGEKLPEITRKLTHDISSDRPTPRFTDITEEAGLGDFVTFRGERSSQLPEDMGAGLAWGDYDRDGDDDLFLVSAGSRLDSPQLRPPSQLFENLGNGRFARVEDFPEPRVQGMAAAWGDYDGDGRLDLVVTGLDAVLLFHNQGDGFVLDSRLASPPGFWAGASWGDFDNDRDLDLYVCGYVQYRVEPGGRQTTSEQFGASVPYTLNPASFEPQPNLLFQNDGHGNFEEVGQLFGVSNPRGRSLSALWHDFDDDGWLDLYVANDISDNALFLNRQGVFEDAGNAAWVSDYRGAMGLTAGDWNRDGDDDLFITHWIAQENALFDSRLSELRESAGATATVKLSFRDLAAPLGLGQPALQAVGWGTEFVDLDADGWLDLVVINGSTLEQGPDHHLAPQPAMLFWNQRGEYFHDLASAVPALAEPRVGRGMAIADFDNDGDPDIAISSLDDGVRLLRNDTPSGNWIELRLRNRLGSGDEPRGFGDGAQATVVVGEIAQRGTVGGASYLSQRSRDLHFGIADATRVDRVEVHWQAGATDVYRDLEANAIWELREGDPVPTRFGAPASEALTADSRAPSREQVARFWELQRAGMDALKRERDLPRAIDLLRQALVLDPGHEDSRYYLANCLAALGKTDDALLELDTLRRANPSSHRAHQQWGVLRAVTASSAEHLEEAEAALLRALEINTETTGGLEVLGELALMRGQNDVARQRLEWVIRSNTQSSESLFLLGYLEWRAGREPRSRELLGRAAAARGEAWKPEGAVAEGDVAQRMFVRTTPLSRFWEAWDGEPEPSTAFAELDAYLADRSRAGTGRSTPAVG